MKLICSGGGPAALLFASLYKERNASHEVLVIDRQRENQASGLGVVLSAAVLDLLQERDVRLANVLRRRGMYWETLDIHCGGRYSSLRGQGYYGIDRFALLSLLRSRAQAAGVELIFGKVMDELPYDFLKADLLVVAEGAHSGTRTRFQSQFDPQIEYPALRHVWFSTDLRHDAFQFLFEKTPHGWFCAHVYPYSQTASSFIVEVPEAVWHQAGLEYMDGQAATNFCERIFADYLKGHRLFVSMLSGENIWRRFPCVSVRRRIAQLEFQNCDLPCVLLGDAAYTAHFTVGSGTRLAFEDAFCLVEELCHEKNFGLALARYQDARCVANLRIAKASINSMSWFEQIERYASFPFEQFLYSLVTRTQRVLHEELRVRDGAWVASQEKYFAECAFSQVGKSLPNPVPLPLFTPFKVRDLEFENRIVVSPMCQYLAHDGVVGDYHLTHYGARAIGGAGLIITEMTAVSEEGRITPSCAGLYRREHISAWKRVVCFVHEHSDAKIGVQLGHAGAKASCQVPTVEFSGVSRALENQGWEVISASAQQFNSGLSPFARTARICDLIRVKADYVRAAQAAHSAGFDLIELHCAHGYLLSSFISPLTNQRQDEYGGSLENRCRFPLEVFSAVRAVWPIEKPIFVRISASDWADGGTNLSDAIAIAHFFKLVGADLIDCSSGMVVSDEKPIYGRMYQTPFSDVIRNETKIPTIAVGNITTAEQVNSILVSGRADLCALGRAHLSDAAWTLRVAAQFQQVNVDWPRQCQAGKKLFERDIVNI